MSEKRDGYTADKKLNSHIEEHEAHDPDGIRRAGVAQVLKNSCGSHEDGVGDEIDDRNGHEQNDPVEKRTGCVKEDDAGGEGAGSAEQRDAKGQTADLVLLGVVLILVGEVTADNVE